MLKSSKHPKMVKIKKTGASGAFLKVYWNHTKIVIEIGYHKIKKWKFEKKNKREKSGCQVKFIDLVHGKYYIIKRKS